MKPESLAAFDENIAENPGAKPIFETIVESSFGWNHLADDVFHSLRQSFGQFDPGTDRRAIIDDKLAGIGRRKSSVPINGNTNRLATNTSATTPITGNL